MAEKEEKAEEAPASSLFDDVFVGDGAEAEDGDSDEEMELDDSQASEIRQIFLTTLPQYLEPVEQMIAQVFGAETADAETQNALLTTLASIAAAAARIGIDDIKDALERMHVELQGLDTAKGAARAKLEKQVLAGLAQINQIASGGEVPDQPPKAKSQTIVEAFKQVEGVDKSVLEKLTAAGVVTVDQLRDARIDEVVAVTGLKTEVVEKLVASLVGPKAAGGPEMQRLRQDLEKRLHTQVELESSLDEIRATVMRLRVKTSELKEQIIEREAERDDLRRAMTLSSERLVGLLSDLSRVRAEHKQASDEDASSRQTQAQLEAQLTQMDQKKRQLAHEQASLEAEVASLLTRVKRMTYTSRSNNDAPIQLPGGSSERRYKD